jgi:hypothetical protein
VVAVGGGGDDGQRAGGALQRSASLSDASIGSASEAEAEAADAMEVIDCWYFGEAMVFGGKTVLTGVATMICAHGTYEGDVRACLPIAVDVVCPSCPLSVLVQSSCMCS